MKRMLILAAALLIPSAAAHAESLVALTLSGSAAAGPTNNLVAFDSATPGTTTTTAVTGLLAGDRLIGIDVRPATNILYGVGTQFITDANDPMVGNSTGIARIYTINVATGVATLASTLAADPADNVAPNPFTSLSGAFFGVDFNPVVDRLRVVSDTGQNLRINVSTGLTQLDVAVAYAAADANAGSPPQVIASAYTNSVNGAGATSLFALDAALSTLATQNPANNGTLNTVDIASSSVFADAGFDISGQTGIGYVVLDGITLATIALTSGGPATGVVVTEVGAINTVGSVTGLAVLPGVIPEPATGALMGCAGVATVFVRRRARRR
ncbi:MAG: DUF4394 domain-containing protein [Pirellulales bacterium]|nr:DUF4394 domain-containing protein [Pirellulales bacterium]